MKVLSNEWNSTLLEESHELTCGDALLKLKEFGESYQLECKTEDLALVVEHLRLMLAKNKVMNLTSIRDPFDSLILHALDSLLFVPALRSCEVVDASSKILDMGTGGGFPGIPLACVTPASVVLLDSVNKKVLACREFSNHLGLDSRLTAVHDRLEGFALQKAARQSFDFVVARALAPLDVLIEYSTPFLRMGRFLVVSKGVPSDEELTHASIVERKCGLTMVSRETFELPLEYGHREFFIYKKTSPSTVRLPRKNGEARNKPLYLA